MTQRQINEACVNASAMAERYYFECVPAFSFRLRKCNAVVYAFETETGRVYVLKSYYTLVAMIDEAGVCYDFLRYVYGYTATSAQHISKFFKDYAPANAERLTYRA